MRYFVKANRYGEGYFASYEGMTQETVVNLLIELNCGDIEFIAESEWEAERPKP